MAAVLLFLMGSQGTLEERIEEILRRYEERAAEEQAATALVQQLGLLGEEATEPLARRLAEDLRDGAASEIAGAILSALEGRPAAQGPLQEAFLDAATPPAGRIELARALLSVLDPSSWREGLWEILLDPGTAAGERLRAATLLLEAGDEAAAALLGELLEDEPPPRSAGSSPAGAWIEEPRAVLGEDRRVTDGDVPTTPEPGRPDRTRRKSLPSALGWGTAAASGGILMWILWRKGKPT